MSYTLQGTKLREALEELINKMERIGLIKNNDKDGLVEKLTQSLEAAHPDGQVPLEVFNNPAEQKKLMGLAICASCEQTIQNDPRFRNNKDLAKVFNTNELAKAMFEKDQSPEEKQTAKQTISAFVLALQPRPGAKSKKFADDLADEMLRQKEEAAAEEQEAKATAAVDDLMEQILAEYNYVQAYGNSPDGTPIIVLIQSSNSMGAMDNTMGSNATAQGYLNEDNDPNNPNISPEVKHAISEKRKELGIEMSDFSQTLVAHKIAPQAPHPTAPGGGHGAGL